ncbi:MAG TPA: hypothetical protein VGO47_03680 [Chlamydiales bacterium]|nr:hypothetical protein [Chlamydiales bacterium]
MQANLLDHGLRGYKHPSRKKEACKKERKKTKENENEMKTKVRNNDKIMITIRIIVDGAKGGRCRWWCWIHDVTKINMCSFWEVHDWI